MPRPRHKNKEIEVAIKYAESRGWEWVRAGSHGWGRSHCPQHARDGHKFTVQSTPRNPYNHANLIRKAVDECDHEPTPPEEEDEE